MALDLQFPKFDQAIVSFGQWITSRAVRMAYQALPYLYEAIGNRIAPQVGGSKIFEGHDHGSLYGGAPIPRGGTCFSSGGRCPLFTCTWGVNDVEAWSSISAFTSPSFAWTTYPFTTLGGDRVAYASPGIDTLSARTLQKKPVYQDLRLRFYWPEGIQSTIQFMVQVRDASASKTYWYDQGADERATVQTTSEGISSSSSQQVVQLYVPVRGDWWNAIEIYVKRYKKNPTADETLAIYDLAFMETNSVSLPAGRGRGNYA